MRKLSIIFILSVLTSCTNNTETTYTLSNPDWMVGEWGWVSSSEQPKLNGECAPENEYYRRDGYVLNGQETARWRIEGDTLVRLQIGEAYGEKATGRPHRSRFTRNAAGELVFKGDGYTQKLVRCGDVPPEWNNLPVPQLSKG